MVSGMSGFITFEFASQRSALHHFVFTFVEFDVYSISCIRIDTSEIPNFKFIAAIQYSFHAVTPSIPTYFFPLNNNVSDIVAATFYNYFTAYHI